MASLLDRQELETLCRRAASLTPASSARWGRMSVEQMLAHLCLAVRMALGEVPTELRGSRAFRTFPLKHLILYVLPFPKGVPTARELLVTDAPPFAETHGSLDTLLRRVGTGPADGPGPRHPLFGSLSRQEWGALVHKHVDHHLRQFGA